MPDAPDIQGRSPKQTISAWNLTELADAVRHCTEEGLKIVDYGKAHVGLGNAPAEPFAVIETAPGVIEHYIPDMTVRVRAATPMRDLQRALADHHQWLPLDGATDAITLGEMVAHNVFGPLRIGFGTARDLLLGLRYVDAAGEEIAVGGRTVKNVAGYDMTKFMVGNLNTFGILTELTIRTFAIPEEIRQVSIANFDASLLDSHGTAFTTSDAVPMHLDLHRPADADRPTLHLAYAGSALSCESQWKALQNWLAERNLCADNVMQRSATLADDQHDRLARRAWRSEANAVVKLIVPPAATGRAIAMLGEVDAPAHTLDALPLHGVIHVGGEWNVSQAKQFDTAILPRLTILGGLRLWIARPDHTADITPFDPPQTDWSLLTRLKQTLDPTNIFNPRRTPWNE